MMARAFVLGLCLGVAIPAAAQKHYKDLAYPPLRELVIPEVERVQLANGLTLYLLEDHSLPKIEGMMLVRTGSRLEPSDKVGLTSILGQVIRTGGSTSRSGEEVDRILENAGASVETGIGLSSGSASLFALEEHFPLVLEILADLVRSPALPEDKIELAKVQERTSIARRNDDVSEVAGRELAKLLYGPESPYGRVPEYADIAAITRDDLVAFHKKYFQPNRVFLGLWGDFDAREARSLVERHFGSWPRPQADPGKDPVPAVDRKAARIVALAEKDDVNQTQIRIGHLGGRIDDPDYFALSVMGEILGGGFSSRLFQTIRTQRGLAYHASAAWRAAYDFPGTFIAASSTKSESTVETIRGIVEEIERIVREPVSEEELRLAKDSILNSFVFNFDGKGEIVSRLMTYDYYGYPRDFLSTYQKRVEEVTAEEVQRAARKHVHPESLVVLAVGRDDDFDAPLSTLGEVVTLDIRIPPPPPGAAATPPGEGDPALGGEILKNFAATASAAIRSFRLEGESEVETPQGKLPAKFQIDFVAPDRYREATVLPFGEIVTVVSGDSAWATTPRGTTDLDADRRRRAHESLYRHYLGLLWAAANGRVRATALEGASNVALEVEGVSMRAGFDPASGRLLSLTLPGTSLEGVPVEERREFSGFESDQTPREIRIFHDGKPAAVSRIAKVTLNPEPSEALFARPAPAPER
jgi:zinc protease